MSFDPTEFREGGNPGPERQLWCAVLGRGVQDATDRIGTDSGSPHRHRIREDAQRWFSANGEDFRFACEMAGFDPDYVRHHVLALIDRGVAVRPPKERIAEAA